MSTPILRRRFTIEEYYRMGETGILSEDDRVELIEGEIVEMTPINSQHASFVDVLNKILSKLCGELAIVRVQNPVRLGAESEPQPDVVLLRPKSDFYASGHPTPKDVLLIVEVSDSSLNYDRNVKVLLYATNGIPEVWIINLMDEQIEIFGQVSSKGFAKRRIIDRESTDEFWPEKLPTVRIKTKDIFIME